MTRLESIRPEFVEFVPKDLEEGILYISVPYRTAVHKCACGCGSKITTPIRPHQWRLTYNGETVSLSPSIGNWSYPCQSHYWIEDNQIEWSYAFSKEKIAKVRARDKADRIRSRPVSEPVAKEVAEEREVAEEAVESREVSPGLLRRLWRRLSD